MKRSYHKGVLVSLLTGFSILILIGMAGAATFCVSSLDELQADLNTAANNDEDDVIQIVQGTYIGNFTYNSSKPYSLRVEGGYDAGCGSRTVSPDNTVLDGNGSGAVLQLNGSLDANVDGITLQNGSNSGLLVSVGRDFILRNCKIQYNTGGNGGGASLSAKKIDVINNTIIFNVANYGGGVGIEGGVSEIITFKDNFISNNITVSAEGGGVYVGGVSSSTTNATVNFINNIISKNATTRYIGGGHGGGAHISTYGTVYFINNTVVGNTANLACCWGGGITIYHAAYANVYNNIFWDNVSNPGRDIAFYSISQDNLNLFNNYIDKSTSGISGLTDFVFDPSNLDAINPLFFDPMNEDYHLTSASPCLNLGTNYAPALPETDKDGLPRIYPSGVYGIVDMGAYEYQGAYEPTAPDLFGGLNEFHYYKLEERIVVKIWVTNRGTKSGEFKVAFYLSDNGVTLGQLIGDSTLRRGLKTGQTTTVSSTYTSESSLSGKYFIAVIDSGDQINEMVETNNRVRARIP